MKTFLLVAWSMLACAASAATHYVDNSCANNGNGQGPTCATSSGGTGPWNSLASASSCSGVSPGDHIQIRRGVGAYREANGGGYYSFQPASGCSGSSAGPGTASTPVYLENYPGENAIIDGSLDIRGSAWTSVGGGVYHCSSGTCTPSHSGSWAWIAWWTPAGGGTEQEIYAIQSSSCDSTVPAGFMYVNGSAGPCVHLPDGSSPGASSHFYIPYITNTLTLANGNSIHDFYVRRNPSGGSLTFRRAYFDLINGSYTSNYNLTIDGVDTSYAINRCIDIDNANFPALYPLTTAPQNDTFTHNHIHHCGQEGIHMGDDTLTETFTYNEVDHIQIPPWFQYCGSSGSVPGGSTTCGPNFTDRGVSVRAWCFAARAPNGCYFANNVFHDSGGGHQWGRMAAIHLEYGAQNTLVENNLIYNMGPLGSHENGVGSGAAAFQMNQFGSYPGCDNCTFRNNRIYNVDDCFNFESSATYNMNIYNNTCVNFSDAFMTIEYGAMSGTINIVNNLLYWSPTADNGASGPITGFIGNGGGSFSATGTFANNSFYCSSGCTGTIVTWSGSSYTSSTITGTGNNTWGDPGIALTATGLPYDIPGSGTTYAPYNTSKLPVPSMRLSAASGSAYQRGQVLSPAFPDYFGTARPSSGAWDIGANAYTATPPTIAPPPNVTPH